MWGSIGLGVMYGCLVFLSKPYMQNTLLATSAASSPRWEGGRQSSQVVAKGGSRAIRAGSRHWRSLVPLSLWNRAHTWIDRVSLSDGAPCCTRRMQVSNTSRDKREREKSLRL